MSKCENVDTMDCKIIHPTDTEFSVSHVSKDVILHPSPVSLRTFSNLIDGVEVIKQFSKKKQTRMAFKFSQNLRQNFHRTLAPPLCHYLRGERI